MTLPGRRTLRVATARFPIGTTIAFAPGAVSGVCVTVRRPDGTGAAAHRETVAGAEAWLREVVGS